VKIRTIKPRGGFLGIDVQENALGYEVMQILNLAKVIQVC